MARYPDLQAARGFLRNADTLLLTSHLNSDGDAIGGCLALRGLLHQMGKTATIVLPGPPDRHYDFLDGWMAIRQARNPAEEQFDHVVIIDCPQRDRIGLVQGYIAPGARLLNLDHHPGNSGFGHVNMVSTEASSACEMIYYLFRAMELDLDTDTASQLYAGIIFDTGGFRYSLARASTFDAAAALVRQGIDLERIAGRVFGSRTFEEVKQLGQAIHSLALHFDDRVATMHLTHAQLRSGDPEEVVNAGLLVEGVEVAVLLKEHEPDHYRISLRSKNSVDVSEVAALFGGGGHTKASGCHMQGTLEQVRNKLLSAIRQHLE